MLKMIKFIVKIKINGKGIMIDIRYLYSIG